MIDRETHRARGTHTKKKIFTRERDNMQRTHKHTIVHRRDTEKKHGAHTNTRFFAGKKDKHTEHTQTRDFSH